MNKQSISKATLLIAAAAVTGIPTETHAEVSPERARQAVSSIRGELFATELAEIRWSKVGVDPNVALLALGRVAKIPPDRHPVASRDGESLQASTSEWTLTTRDSAGSLVWKGARAGTRSVAARWSNDRAFAAGRQVLAELDAVLPRVAGEAVVDDQVLHVMAGSATAAGQHESRWAGSTVFFSRAVDGVPLLGGDPALVVDFDADGGVTGVEYNWSRLERTLERRRTLAREVVLGRLTPGARGGQMPALLDRSGTFATLNRFVPVELGAGAVLEELRCGYRAPDAASPPTGVLSMGCEALVMTTVQELGGPMRHGKILEIPLEER